jgi:hypothetical protein
LSHHFASVFNTSNLLGVSRRDKNATKGLNMPAIQDTEIQEIPRDANGKPIFLILPPGVQASYDRKMKNCETGWTATGDPWAVAEAHTWAHLHRQPSSAWLDDAVWALACQRRTKRHAKRAREAQIRIARYDTVRAARLIKDPKTKKKLSWTKACELAAENLADKPDLAADSEKMWKAYKQVKKHLKEGRGGLYFTPKEQRRRTRA